MFWNFILSFPSVANGQSDKCKDCAAGQCATHCYVLLLRWGCDKHKGGNNHSEISLRKKRATSLNLCLAPFGDRLKDGYKYEKAKVKKVKRTIPAWASVTASKKVPVTNFAGTQNKVDNILIEAITVCANSWESNSQQSVTALVFCFSCYLKNILLISSPLSLQSCNDRFGVSYQSVMKYIVKKYPGMELDKKKFLIKKAMKKHLEKGTIKQVKTVNWRRNIRLHHGRWQTRVLHVFHGTIIEGPVWILGHLLAEMEDNVIVIYTIICFISVLTPDNKTCCVFVTLEWNLLYLQREKVLLFCTAMFLQ